MTRLKTELPLNRKISPVKQLIRARRKMNQKSTIMIDLNLSRILAARTRIGIFLALFLLAGLLAASVTQAAGLAAANAPAAIPWNQIGAKAGADYQGDGLAVTPTVSGARLHCVFQRLDGEATAEGLWLTSTVTNTVSDRFRVTAMAVGRVTPCAPGAADRKFNIQHSTSNIQLAGAGEVSVCGQTVRLSRAGLTEEYSVSMDGVRQDFIVEQAPPSPSAGELVVKLAVAGAQVEADADGARLVLNNSGRKIAYSRLRVTDATGKELPVRIEVTGRAGSPLPAAIGGDTDNGAHGVTRPTLAVVVNDADAVYPVRIDPTFSDANWVSMGGVNGANSAVNAAVIDGSGNLYIGGGFTIVGDTEAIGIAEWNGSSWSALGSGINGGVFALAVSGATLYAGGTFTTAGGIAATNIAQWNGSSWSALGSGMGGSQPSVSALAVSGSTVYAGGQFTTAGGTAANNIAQWTGSSWSPLGSGMNGTVLALAVSGSTLYAGGDFSYAGGNPANYVAQWNGSSWSALEGGMSYLVSALAVSGGTLYAGGSFTGAGGRAANYIAQWNGSSWSPVGSGMSGYVTSLAVSGSTLYVGGAFYTAGGNTASYIAQWNGSSWSALGGGVGNTVFALAVSGSTVYAGGYLLTAGGNPANYIAQWNGSDWSALGSAGPNGEVSAVAVSGGTLYAGGLFTMAGTNAVSNIAQWNGSSWSALGPGVSEVGSDYYGPVVLALAVSGGMLYAGGEFYMAGTNEVNFIAQWNGSNWSPLGPGLTGPVNALVVSGGTLYAGGEFEYDGNNDELDFIAQWDGTNWSPLGSGMNDFVYALAVSGNKLYAGGEFTTAGAAAANAIAQWNGSSWSALGLGMSGGELPFQGDVLTSVAALVVSGSTLYAGGDFTQAGGIYATNIAQWNGSRWSPLGSGMNGVVDALAVSGSTLYAGGSFYMEGADTNANYIAQWNGNSWSSLGSGVGGGEGDYVSALAVSGSTLYAGGLFTTAGTNASYYAAMANLAGTQASPAIITTNAAFGFMNGEFGFDVSGPSGSTVIIQASTDLQTWTPLRTNLLGSGPLFFSDPKSPANVQRFYRAQLLP
jgi:hypothetical protein